MRFARPLLALALLAAPARADQQPVLLGTGALSGKGDPLFTAYTKLNANDAELYARIANLQAQISAIQGISGRLAALNAGTIDGVTIGGTTPAGGSFTSLNVSGAFNVVGGVPAATYAGTLPAATGTAFGSARASILVRGASAWGAYTPATTGCTFQFNGTDTVCAASSPGTGAVRYDASQGLTFGQQTQALANISGTPAARQILATGLATGGGDLSADRTITVPKAAQADVATGTDDAKALTSLSVAPALAAKAPLASPALTGTPTAPTAAAGTNTTQVATAAFLTAAALRGDLAQSFTATQRDQARVNLGGAASSAPSASATLAVADFDRPLFPTGSPTLTMPNGGAGWRTGPILNANPWMGVVPLAVPSGATLDGVTNGTTTLYPYQKARIVQTGASAYVTDWIDRAPVIGVVTIAAGVASADFALPDGYPRFRLRGSNISLSATGNLGLRFGDGGGVKAGTNDYYSQRNQAFSATGQGRAAIDSYGYLTVAQSDASNASKAVLDLMIYAGATGSNPKAMGQSFIYDGTDPYILFQVGIDYPGTTTGAMGRATLMRLLATAGAGTLTGSFTLTGEP